MRHVKWVSIRRASHASLPSTQRRPPLPCCAISIWGQALRIALLAIVPGTSPLVASGQTRPGKAADAGEVVYRMQPGDSPWSISETLLSDMAFWPRIVQRNGFGSRAAQLPPGTLVRIPQAWLRRRDVPATVLAVVDDVVIAAVDGTRRAAEPGASLLVGERLSTSNIGSATLELHDGSRVLVRPSTDVELGTSNLPIALDPETGASLESGPAPASGSMLAVQLRLLRGALENAVQQIGPAGRFEIETPAAVAAVRGTRLRLSVQDDAVNAELPQGAAQLKNAQAGRGLDAGEGTRTVAGRPPEPPSLLLPAPDLAALPDEITRLPIELPFALTPDATGYRTQLATLDTDALVSDRLTRGPRLSVREPPNGDYRLRVRAVDPRGLEGFDVERIVRVHVRPTPPLLIAPAPDGRSADERPLYRWSQAVSTAQGQPVRNVRLQVAADPSFATPLLDLSLPGCGRSAARADAGHRPLALAPARHRLRAWCRPVERRAVVHAHPAGA